jgi:hypothetical protein
VNTARTLAAGARPLIRPDSLPPAGPPSLWDALTASTKSADDLARLGEAGYRRGLYRHAAVFWTAAVTRGNADAAKRLIALLREMNSSDTTRAARWAADDPACVSID